LPPWTYCGSLRVRLLDNQTHLLLQYNIKVIFASTWHTETRTRPAAEHVFRSAEVRVVRGCLEKEVDMTTLMASMASRMENYEKINVEGGTDAFMFRASQVLRKHMAKKSVTDEELAMGMFHLCCAESYRLNTVGALVHLRACKKITIHWEDSTPSMLILPSRYLSAISL